MEIKNETEQKILLLLLIMQSWHKERIDIYMRSRYEVTCKYGFFLTVEIFLGKTETKSKKREGGREEEERNIDREYLINVCDLCLKYKVFFLKSG